MVKNLPATAGDPDLIPGSRRYPGEGNGYLFQDSWLENSMDRGTWWATVHGCHQRVGHDSETKQLLHIEWANYKVLLCGTENYSQYPMVNHNGKEYLYTYN